MAAGRLHALIVGASSQADRGKGIDLLGQQIPGLGGCGCPHQVMTQSRGAGEARAGPSHVFAGNQQPVVAAILHEVIQLIAGQRKSS